MRRGGGRNTYGSNVLERKKKKKKRYSPATVPRKDETRDYDRDLTRRAHTQTREEREAVLQWARKAQSMWAENQNTS